MTIPGIDVSHHQGGIHWPRVAAAGTAFAYLKASEGIGFVDSRLQRNVIGARRAGIPVGAYHYARPSASGSGDRGGRIVKDAVAEAIHFHDTAGDLDLPPALDLEEHGGLAPNELGAWTRVFLHTCEQRFGVTPLVYCSPGFWDARVAGIGDMDRYPLWVAHWHTRQPRLPRGWTRWTVWQWTSDGHVDGIAGRVDRNHAQPQLIDPPARPEPATLEEAIAMLTTGYVAHAATPTGDGYWILDREGGVWPLGDATYHGSIPQLREQGQDIGDADAVALTPTPSGDGYWILDNAGGIFTFGDATYHGSIPSIRQQRQETNP